MGINHKLGLTTPFIALHMYLVFAKGHPSYAPGQVVLDILDSTLMRELLTVANDVVTVDDNICKNLFFLSIYMQICMWCLQDILY